MIDRLSTKPFQEWIEKRVEFYEQQYRFGGEDLSTAPITQRVAEDLGWTGAGGIKRLYRYRYAKTDSKPNGRNGPSVLIDVSDFDRDRVEEALWSAGVFLREVYPEVENTVELTQPVGILAHPELVVEAKSLYDSGFSMAEVSRELLPGSGYSSWGSLSHSLRKEFRNQGWELRDAHTARQLRSESTPTCAGTSLSGLPCGQYAMAGSLFCSVHEKRHGLDPEPFVTWVRGRIGASGLLALAAQWGIHNRQLYRWQAGRMRWIRPTTVRKVVAVDGTTTFEELYG